ncbi:hypothetical protein Tco_0185138 [Tanacetum coccineum]
MHIFPSADQDYVRLLTVEGCASLGKLLKPEDCVAHILPIIVNFSQVTQLELYRHFYYLGAGVIEEFADIISASVLFESALGPEGSIHLRPSSSLNALSNVVPSDAAAPVKSIPEGSPPSPPLIQPTIPVIMPPIPQPGPATKSLAYPPTTLGNLQTDFSTGEKN